MEGWKLCANYGLVCTLENFDGVENLCFADATNSQAGQKHKSLLI
jgi:hypothetical protein